jgi:hypothetical protein
VTASARPPPVVAQLAAASPAAPPHNPFAINMYGKRPRPKRLVDRITALGLHEPLGEVASPWGVDPPDDERARAEELSARVTAHVSSRNLSDSRLTTATGLLEDFQVAFPNWVLFKPVDGPFAVANAVHNERTFGMIAEFKRAQGSKQVGKVGQQVLSKSIAGYISALRAERSIGAGYNLLSSKALNISAIVLKAMRREDGPGAARALRRGLRIQHFKAAVLGSLDIWSRSGLRRWARALTAWNLLLRGGEVGTVDARDFVPDMGLLTLASVTFFSREELALLGKDDGFPACRFMIVPIKDAHARAEPPRPNWIRRRWSAEDPLSQHRGHLSDPTCPYDVILELFNQESAGVAPADYRLAPLFRNEDGCMVRTGDIRVDMRIIGAAAGLDPAELGASSGRIGGAEDLYDRFEEDANPIIQERGRWATDIHTIYQRASASRHMRISAQMGESMGISMEAAAPIGFALPARRTVAGRRR